MIYFFYLHTTIRQKCMTVFHLFFLCAQSFDQKLGSSLIYFFYVDTTIRPRLGVTLNLSFIVFLIVPIFRLLYSCQHCPYISFALFLAALSLYFVCYIDNSTTLIFRTLYPWKSCSFISYAISMDVKSWVPFL